MNDVDPNIKDIIFPDGTTKEAFLYMPKTPYDYQDGGYSLCVEGYPWDMFA